MAWNEHSLKRAGLQWMWSQAAWDNRWGKEFSERGPHFYTMSNGLELRSTHLSRGSEKFCRGLRPLPPLVTGLVSSECGLKWISLNCPVISFISSGRLSLCTCICWQTCTDLERVISTFQNRLRWEIVARCLLQPRLLLFLLLLLFLGFYRQFCTIFWHI